jgi:hypothetical protein
MLLCFTTSYIVQMSAVLHREESEMTLGPYLYVRHKEMRQGIEELFWIVYKVNDVAIAAYLFFNSQLKVIVDNDLVLFKWAHLRDKVRHNYHTSFLKILLYLKANNFPQRFLRDYIMKLHGVNAWYLFHYIVCNHVSKLLFAFCPKWFLSLPCLDRMIFRMSRVLGRLTGKHRGNFC